MLQKLLDHALVRIYKGKITLKFSKAAYVGICILDWSKVLMYEFRHDFIRNKYGEKPKLLFTDADSFMYFVYEVKDVYEDFSEDKEFFDFSNYSAKSKYYDVSNKLVVVKMEHETGGVAIKECTGLKPKLHFVLVDNTSEHKKA